MLELPDNGVGNVGWRKDWAFFKGIAPRVSHIFERYRCRGEGRAWSGNSWHGRTSGIFLYGRYNKYMLVIISQSLMIYYNIIFVSSKRWKGRENGLFSLCAKVNIYFFRIRLCFGVRMRKTGGYIWLHVTTLSLGSLSPLSTRAPFSTLLLVLKPQESRLLNTLPK